VVIGYVVRKAYKWDIFFSSVLFTQVEGVHKILKKVPRGRGLKQVKTPKMHFAGMGRGNVSLLQVGGPGDRDGARREGIIAQEGVCGP
jgi:hypothetical protein